MPTRCCVAGSHVTQGITRQLLAGLLCGAPGKGLVFMELVLSVLKVVITLDGWLVLILGRCAWQGAL